MKELNSMDKLFKESFESFEVTPDLEVKSKIDAEIFSPKKKRNYFIWLLLPFFISGFAYLFLPVSKTEKTSFAEGSVRLDQKVYGKISVNNLKIKSTKKQTSELFSHQKKSDLKVIEQEPKTKNTQINGISFYKEASKKTNSAKLNSTLARPTEDVSIAYLALKKLNFSSCFSRNLSLERNNSTSIPVENAKDIPINYINFMFQYSFDKTSKKNNAKLHENVEFGTVKSKGFKYQIEYGRKIKENLFLHGSIGYSLKSILQESKTIIWDSITDNNITTSVPTPLPVYLNEQSEGNNLYRYSGVQIGLGINYQILPRRKLNFEIAGGTSLQVGSNKLISSNSTEIEIAKKRDLGLSIYLRPSVHYNFKKCSLFMYGNVQQAIISDVYWDFVKYRSPSFGGGIGFRIWF